MSSLLLRERRVAAEHRAGAARDEGCESCQALGRDAVRLQTEALLRKAKAGTAGCS